MSLSNHFNSGPVLCPLQFILAYFLMLIFMNQWFWVAMPFMLTYLVMALGYM